MSAETATHLAANFRTRVYTLLAEAEAAGDTATVADCKAVIDGSIDGNGGRTFQSAALRVARVLDAASAMNDGE